jgi:predicted AlkP superfamily pyrophosphatase or phosphodiesterase
MPSTLPRPPKDLAAIRHVFKSALQSVQGIPNELQLLQRDRVVVCFIDGLGVENLRQRSGHAPFLSSQLGKASITYAAYPATTSVNIGCFATGLMPGEHGLIGHQVFDRFHDERINLLVGWNERTDPLVWQPHQTISEQASEAGVKANVIAAEEYRTTPFTTATMRGANFIGADSIEDRVKEAILASNASEKSISYVYFPELDKYGHQKGWTSGGWAQILESVDSGMRLLASKLGKKTGLVITSDHGMIETTKDKQLILDQYLDGLSLEFFGGDTRSSYVYFQSKQDAQKAIESLEPVSYALGAHLSQELIEAGWFGGVGKEARDRMPDLILIAKSNYTLYHSKFSKQRAFDMISHHGAFSDAELRIPLIRLGF